MATPDQAGTAFAKTTRPAVGSMVERTTLFARLDTPIGRTVVWISGPAGSGKTTLAATYVQARSLATIWYQVDADDADPATFFHYLAHAARKLDGGRPLVLPAFAARQGGDVASFSRRFFRQLFAGAGAPLALVIDNLQDAASTEGLSTLLGAGLAQVPKGSTLILTSRNEPPASLARLRASGQMTCVTGRDLLLSPEEIVWMARLRGQSVSPESAAKLHERTQGWAAGLTLMLEHAKISGRVAELSGDATPQAIFDYLAGEIFDRFEARTREFLLRIACLPRMTGAMASVLANEPKAERLLLNLALNDYFVREAHSEGGRVFQLHPLLRDFLRQRAEQELPEAASLSSLERAAGLMRGAGYAEDAVALFAEAGNWEGIATIVLEECERLLAQGRHDNLASWLDFLPSAMVEASARLLCLSAASRAHASPRAARQLFERAYEKFRDENNVAGMLASCRGIVDSIVFEFDDLASLDRWLDVLDRLLARGEGAPPGELDAAAATLVAATLLRDAGHRRVDLCLGRSVRDTDDGSEHLAARFGDERLDELRALAALARGDLTAAEAALGDVPDGARDSANIHLGRAVAESVLGLVAGAHDRSIRAAESALAAADAEGLHAYDPWLTSILAAARLCRGDVAAAQALLQRLDPQAIRLRRGDRASVHYLHAWAAMLEGEIADALREAKTALVVAIEAGIPWFECLARIALAGLLADGADRRAAEAQSRAAAAIAERLRSPWLSFSVAMAAAHVARVSGNRSAMLDSLRIAFRLAHEQGFRQPLGSRPQVLAELCAVALEEGIEPELARAFVRDGRLAPATPPLRIRCWPWPFRITTLGGFECRRGEIPVELSAKGPGRPMELLKVLVAEGCHNVRADQLADALWPSTEADYAYKSFTATLHRLRRALEDDDALVLRDGRLTLNRRLVWVDTWALEQLFDDFDAALRGADACPDETLCLKTVEEVLELYRGPFLANESEQPGYIACRERIRARLLRFLARAARGWDVHGRSEAAADCYLRLIEADELYEPFYRQLMGCYQRRGAIAEALAAYERLRTLSSARLRAMPSPEMQAFYAALKSAATAGS